MGKHTSPKPTGIGHPILAKHALAEFGLSWKWLRPRVASGEIRSRKVGRYLVLERSDVERLAPSAADRDLLARALGKGRRP